MTASSEIGTDVSANRSDKVLSLMRERVRNDYAAVKDVPVKSFGKSGVMELRRRGRASCKECQGGAGLRGALGQVANVSA